MSVVTNVGLEHTDLLGDTVAEIAAEKAGIAKKSIPLILGEADEAYNAVFEQKAAALKTRVIYAERDFTCMAQENRGTFQRFDILRRRDGGRFQIDLDLIGSYQAHNLLTACAARRLPARRDPPDHQPAALSSKGPAMRPAIPTCRDAGNVWRKSL